MTPNLKERFLAGKLQVLRSRKYSLSPIYWVGTQRFFRLSLGWYESVFASYLARKVRYFLLRGPLLILYLASKSCYFYGWVNSFNRQYSLTSSAGEQSVGKSYALNHFVDTSFAGSAMRCTEGVWLSMTPTHDALIVSMDFEGTNVYYSAVLSHA